MFSRTSVVPNTVRCGSVTAVRPVRSVAERSTSEDVLGFFEGYQHSSYNAGLALVARVLLWFQMRRQTRLQERRAF
jgi:hypothetical protein